MQYNTIDELVNAVWSADVTLDKSETDNFVANSEVLKKEGIIAYVNGDKVTFTRNNIKANVSFEHNYVMPNFVDEVRCNFKQAISGKHSANLLLVGGAGTGKTEFVYEMAKEFGYKVFQVNGSEGLTAYDFYGTMAVAVDPITKQNYTHFDKGALYRAFIEGTELDADGNQVLDENGNPKVVGNPGLFFLDEFASMLPEVFLGIFNRAMEIPRKEGASRSIEIPMDNGRIVKSHPCFMMILAGNTVGTGNSGKFQMSYTAQSNRMDESTLNRITATYRFGYNRKAEKNIVLGALNDDLETEKLMNFRDKIRNLFKNEKVERIFSTRTIVQIVNIAIAYRDGGMKNYVAKAIKNAVFCSLPDNDKDAWNETIRAIWGVDFLQEEAELERQKEYDFM